MEDPIVTIFCGQTGVGKTTASLEFALETNGEIINADMAQIYAPLSIGTGQISADLQRGIPHHLFGFINEPILFNVFQMRLEIRKKVQEILARDRHPIIVGGSHFLIFCLFFAPASFLIEFATLPLLNWRSANAVFVESEKQESDIFFAPDFAYNVFIIERSDPILHEKLLKQRIIDFIAAGWLSEVSELSCSWKVFLLKKKIIGYPELIYFLEEEDKNLEMVLEEILLRTRQYAKKQRTFIRKLVKDISLFGIPVYYR